MQSLLQVVPNHILQELVLETPYVVGVEPELKFGRRAVCDLLNAIDFLPFAVGPQSNQVEVIECFRRGICDRRVKKISVNIEFVASNLEFVK
jgi:hypothetical protein